MTCALLNRIMRGRSGYLCEGICGDNYVYLCEEGGNTFHEGVEIILSISVGEDGIILR
jgi:hypothetical protein